MQYKSITYQRVIVPRAYESKRLEVTVELDEEDNPIQVIDQLKALVEDLLVTQEMESNHFFTNAKDLAALEKQIQEEYLNDDSEEDYLEEVRLDQKLERFPLDPNYPPDES